MKRIVLVDDNADNRLLVRAFLGRLYVITEYEDGPEAIEGLRRDPPDLVLMDISLPTLNGDEVLHWIRAQEALRGTPVIAFTAHSMQGDRQKFLMAGFDDYLAKPIADPAALLQAVRRWTER